MIFLYILLYILLAVLLILLLILFFPVHIQAKYTDQLYCVLKIGFLKFQLAPQKPKKKKKTEKTGVKKPAGKKKEEPSVLKQLWKQQGLSGLIQLLKKAGSALSGVLKDLAGHMIIKEFYLDIAVAGEDAADAAVHYGYCCSVIYPAVSLLTGSAVCKKRQVSVYPNFEENAQTAVVCRADASIRVFWLIANLFANSKKILSFLLQLRGSKENNHEI